MKNYINKYFKTWWIPIITYIGLQEIYVRGLRYGSRVFFILFPYILVPVAISIFISSLVILVKKKWYVAIGQVFLGIVIVLFYYVLPSRDIFFSNLKIPDNIEYKTPIDLQTPNSANSIMTLSRENGEFFIANYGQGGMYKTFVWISPKEEGRIYVKAFEAKGNIPLTNDRIRKATELKVVKGELRCYSQEFTIYDGVWKSYYLGRIEIWFNPTNGEDYKLADELYKIEGWIR